jgi:hypothetical protein
MFLNINFYTSLISVSLKNENAKKLRQLTTPKKWTAFLLPLPSVPQLSLDVPAEACFLSDKLAVIGKKVGRNCAFHTERK